MKPIGWRTLRKLIPAWRHGDLRAGGPVEIPHAGAALAPLHPPAATASEAAGSEAAASETTASETMTTGTGRDRQLFLPLYQAPLRLPAPTAAQTDRQADEQAAEAPGQLFAPATPITSRRLQPMASPAQEREKKGQSRRPTRRLALALQGGGAHGAFTWGVLDRLLEESDIEIAAVSGSSAGALNAVALAGGLLEDGHEGARRRLDQLWRRAAGLAEFSGLPATPLDRLAPSLGVDWSPGHLLFDLFTRYVSPYQFNPFGIDPLRQLLRDLVDIDALKDPAALPLFIAATRVDDGAMQLFGNRDLSIEAILASACLPAINQAIKIEDAYYWDGGFSANPPLLPLVSHGLANPGSFNDLLLVRVDPVRDDSMPITAGGIRNRLNRLMFNAPLNAELRALNWLRGQLRDPALAQSTLGRNLAHLRLHSLGADDAMRQFGSASKLRPDLHLIERLHELGRAVADDWLEEHMPQRRSDRRVSRQA
jgi:NTE family protein